MTNIRVKHTLIDERSILELLQGYNLGPISRCSFLTRGLNDTYLIITPRKQYIFRVYRYGWRNKEAIQFEIDALQHLKNKTFTISHPIAKRDGTYLNEIDAPEGLRYGMLFSYSQGERPAINARNAQLIGESLGKLHHKTDDFHSEYNRGFKIDLNHLLDEPTAMILPVINKFFGKKVEGDVQEIVENLKTGLRNKELEIGFCHGDFHNHNMHVENGKIEVFDFDGAAMGFRAYDVAVSWWNLLTNYGEKEEECWEAFLKGYSSQRTLAKDDFASLPLLITARRFWLLGTMLQNEDVWGTNWINKQSLELFILQIKTDMIREM
ncbi:Ser/Thr protein kinase RdoA (MazF antagonist) [Virgibacillus natechei]|uniref:Ser/Thr protein kinase RdoA (MazF antagonist) n=1 Tax=Virgibacillus natechei TaxID=1216297 RepID=A0ABS4IHR6_9BACI|nr:phosphotransferase [Virgibacillus natechei]MBP1970115.1 Ser/Thr protein kinase RdoA (MazF antagonist) [Virgibacillus natechei]UZD14192.1 phosphotransferase [Virgibacillus natechei]